MSAPRCRDLCLSAKRARNTAGAGQAGADAGGWPTSRRKGVHRCTGGRAHHLGGGRNDIVNPSEGNGAGFRERASGARAAAGGVMPRQVSRRARFL